MRDGTPLKNSKGQTTSHLVGLLARATTMLEYNIKPVFIYDGETPQLKSAERERRAELKEEAGKKHAQAVEDEDVELMKKYAGRTAKLTQEMITESQELLTHLGIPWMIAPAEAEAQAAKIAQNGHADYVASQDYDALLFGAKKLVRNLNSSGKRKRPGTYSYNNIEPELIELEKLKEELKLTQKQLIMLAMIVGTDFNIGGIKGLGPKKGLKKVREHEENLQTLFEDIGWPFEADYKEVFELLSNMPVTNEYTIQHKSVDEEALTKYLVEGFEFSETRVENAIEKIRNRQQQKGLSEFF